MTRYVVNTLKEELEKRSITCDIFDMDNVRTADVSIDSFDAVGIAYPVHSFNAPKIVIDYAKQLPTVNSLDMFIISTAGAYSRTNFASSRLLVRMMRKKGYSIYYDRQFIMPSNFIVKDDSDTVSAKLEKIITEIPSVADEIINRCHNMLKDSFLTRAIAFLGRAEWLGAKWMGRFFYTDDSCNHCGVCAADCPNRNISVENGLVRFKSYCGLCMRCLYICPSGSIKLRRPFRFLGFEHWYDTGVLSLKASRDSKSE
jgi:ferredoxin